MSLIAKRLIADAHRKLETLIEPPVLCMMLLAQQRRPEKPQAGGRIESYINVEIRAVSFSKSSLPPCIKGITERGTTSKITGRTKRAE